MSAAAMGGVVAPAYVYGSTAGGAGLTPVDAAGNSIDSAAVIDPGDAASGLPPQLDVQGGAGRPASADPGTGPGSSIAGDRGQSGSDGDGGGSSGSRSGPALSGNQAGPATGSTIVLGNIGTYSGVAGAIVVGLQEMIGVWQKWVNAHGGLNGHPVRVIIEDDGGDPAKALTIAHRMVEKDHIVAFFNPYLLFDFDQISRYAASVNIPIIGGDGVNPAWSTTNITFPNTASVAGVANAGNRYFARRGLKKIGIVYCLDSPALCAGFGDAVKETAPKSGGTLEYSAAVSLTAPSFTSQCINAKKAGVQALWMIIDGASAVRMAKDCAVQGYHPKFGLLGTALQPAVTSAPELQGSIVPAFTFPSAANRTPAEKAYHEAVAQYAPGLALSGNTAGVWTAGALIVEASKYLSQDPTPAEFFKGLYTIKNNNLGGLTVPLTFTPGTHATQGSCAFMIGIEDRKFTAPIGDQLVC